MQQRQYDYSRVLKLFQTHSSIKIKEAIGAPPEKYYVIYNIDGLIQTGKSIEAKNEHIVEITLPQMYPGESPKARMVTALFHPNVSADMIDLKGIWTRETALADCIVRIGELITFQRYSTDEPLNNEAAQWALRNKSLLPLSNVDLGYHAIEDTVDAFMDTKTEIGDLASEKENEEEKTKVFGAEDETAQIVVENITAPDTVAIIREQESEAPAEISKETKKEPAAIEKDAMKATIDSDKEKMKKMEDLKIETERRKKQMITEKKDDVKNKEPVKEKMINKPVSAQIGVNNDQMTRATELFQEFSRDASADRARDLKKTKFIAIENNIRTVPPGVQENQQSPVVSPSVQSRFAHGGPFCHHCGSHVDEYAHFCGQCGSKLRVKSSQRIAKIFFIIGMIAIPIIIFEVGSLIFLLNKKIGAPSSAPELIQPASEQPAALPPAVQKDKKTIVKMEPAPVPEKSIANVPNKEHQAIAPEPMKPVATKAETFKPAPPVYEAPKPAPAAVEAPKPAPKKVEAAEAPKPAPAAVEVPKPAPAAVEAPKPLPATVQAPAAAVTGAGAAKKKTAVDDYLSKAEGAAPQENAKNATVNQSALEDNLKLARLYMGIGSYDDAISRYREVVKTDPYNQEAIQGLMQAKKMKATTSGK